MLFAPGLPHADAAAVLLNLAVTAAILEPPASSWWTPIPINRCWRIVSDWRSGPVSVMCYRSLATLEQSLQTTELAHLVVLAAGGPTPTGLHLVVETPASLLAGSPRKRCDLLFVRGPSWADGGDTLATVCDAVYLVLPEREAGSPHVDELLQTFSRQEGRLGGCILAAG